MDSPAGSVGSDLRRQNEELRARLAGEAADHKRRLDAYRRAQQGQAALVSRLQAKVLQYKQRCAELESHMLETPRTEGYRTSTALQPAALPAPSPPSTDSRRDERINDLETALRRLDEEKRKCEKLVAQNNLLRDQLEESHQLNEALTGDLQKLTNDWEALRDEMAVKEDEWKDEEQIALNDTPKIHREAHHHVGKPNYMTADILRSCSWSGEALFALQESPRAAGRGKL
ncbi:rootletin-like [Bombyx mandarina]|uniref:Rootletin-like n=1 Tax=Bombyx mandarina TaxID=7092 RepID=A0A6J2K946_BOMMA|nr:rootletin-like [Bombyx mandarina]